MLCHSGCHHFCLASTAVLYEPVASFCTHLSRSTPQRSSRESNLPQKISSDIVIYRVFSASCARRSQTVSEKLSSAMMKGTMIDILLHWFVHPAAVRIQAGHRARRRRGTQRCLDITPGSQCSALNLDARRRLAFHYQTDSVSRLSVSAASWSSQLNTSLLLSNGRPL